MILTVHSIIYALVKKLYRNYFPRRTLRIFRQKCKLNSYIIRSCLMENCKIAKFVMDFEKIST